MPVWYYNNVRRNKHRSKGENTMKKNIWKSIYTNTFYAMDLDWLPEFEGYELVATLEGDENTDWFEICWAMRK